LALAVIALSAFLWLPTRFLHEANPIWRLTSLLWALEVVALTLCVIYLVGGFGWLRHFCFPVGFFLVAVPWPSGLEGLLVQSLMRFDAAATVELLGLFGVPAVQHGNVIEVGTGVVGIDDACSGIRSFQATLMISLFLGELYRLRTCRRLGLIASGFALAFAFNVGRTLLLTGIASARGVGAVASWHDPAGVAILVVCFVCLWVLALWLQRRTGAPLVPSPVPDTRPSPRAPCPSTGPGFRWSCNRLVPLSLLAWLLLVEGGTEFWYRRHEGGASDHLQWSVRWPANQTAFEAIEIPPGIRGQFRYDQGIEGRWRDADGGAWQLYYFRWFPGRSLSQRVAVHLAKTHGPEKCLPAAGMRKKSDLGLSRIPAGDLELAVHQYEFEAEGRLLHVFYGIYEDQGGSRALVNRRLTLASRIDAALSGSRNYGQRFLEVAVFGYERPEDARAALTRELATRIKVDK